jgi:hypothetical protein
MTLDVRATGHMAGKAVTAALQPAKSDRVHSSVDRRLTNYRINGHTAGAWPYRLQRRVLCKSPY